MPDFLSDEWFDSLAVAATRAEVSAETSLVVQQIIGSDPVISWWICIEDGVVIVDRGEAREADVRLTTDRDTAIGIHRGEVSAQRAFLDGRLRIGGDIAALMTHREALETVAPLLGLT